MNPASFIMSLVDRMAIAVAAVAVVLLLPLSGLAQSSGDPDLQSVQRWNDVLGRAEIYADVRSPSDFGLSFHREQLDQIRDEAAQVRDAARQRLLELEQVLSVLGPRPGSDAVPEPDETAHKRQTYEIQLSNTRTALAEAELALARVKALESDLASAARQSLLDSVLVRLPFPLSPVSVWAATQDAIENFRAKARAFDLWYRDPSEADAELRGAWRHVQNVIALVAAFLAGWFARKWILRRFGRDQTIEDPSYARAVVAAVADALARGVIPALIIVGLIVFLSRPGALVIVPAQLAIQAFLGITLFLILVVAITRAVLAPELPQWRTIEIAPENAHRITRIIKLMAVVYAGDIFFRIVSREFVVSQELLSVALTIAVTLQAAAMLALSRRTLWVSPLTEDVADSEASEKVSKGRFWPYVRGILAVGATVAVVATLIGYGVLAHFLIDRIVITLVVIALLFLVRGILREVVGALTQSPVLRSRLRMQSESLRKIRFWVRGALDPVLVVIGALIVLPFWGVPVEELSRWSLAVLQGFKIGNVTISPFDIVLAVAVFVGTMAATRFVQRRLLERVLPQTNLSVSVQHSLTAVIGYIGAILAAALAIAVVGVDLTNIALVAGALSVGIGFGLQNVVNNFVSGVILLAERPIKVGDWIVVGGMEGFVKRINFRGTELETFQRASVIIPNAEILSTPLTNWTHKDRRGRIDIAIGVAYGSDTARVRDVLLEVAQANDQVLTDPQPFVLFMDFGASSLDFELRCFAGEVILRPRIASEIRFEIVRRFREEGIEIPFPQRVVHKADGS